jgi:O-antigen ligase
MRSSRLTHGPTAAKGDRMAPPGVGGAPRVWAERSGKFLVTLMIWALVLVMVAPNGLDHGIGKAMVTAANPVSRTVWLAILGVAAALLIWRSSRTIKLIAVLNPYLLAMLGLAAASYFWSIAPDFTIVRVIRFMTIVMTGMCLALIGWTPGRFAELMRSTLTFVCVASILMVWLDPVDGINHADNPALKDSWNGITFGKNVLGSLAVSTIVVWLHGILTKESRLIVGLGGLSAGIVCLIGSRSSTSIMAAVFASLFMLLLMKPPGALKRSMPYLVGTFAAIILVYALAVLHLVPYLGSLLLPIEALTGKDLTFSGRINIWMILTDQIRQNPLLGTGYGAYWTGANPGSPSYVMLERLWFYPNEGHNGYLDVINELGTLGGVVLLGYFIRYIRDALTLMRSQRQLAALYLTFMFRGFIADMSESHWFSALTPDFVIITLATCALARSLLQMRLEPVAAPRVREARTPSAVAASPPTALPGRRRVARMRR